MIAALLLAALGDAGVKNGPPTPDAAASEARLVFEAHWKKLLADPALRANWEPFDRLVKAGPSGTRSLACRALRDEVSEMLGVGARDPLIAPGLAKLDRAGACWRIDYEGRLRTGLAAAVSNGEVLLVWKLPEG